MPARRAMAAGLLAAALGLAGCGFHPMYGSAFSATSPGAVDGQLDGIYVALLPNRTGQLLRQALQERLDRSDGAARTLQLNVVYGIDADAIAVQADNSSARTRVVAHAAWTLTEPMKPGSPIVTSGTARALDGFNVVNEQFFFVTLENEAAQRRLADACADQITRQLLTYFRTHPRSA